MPRLLGMDVLSKFIRCKLGYGSKTGVSIYELTCDVLASYGIPRPDNVSYQKCVENNLDFINEECRKLFGKKVLPKPIAYKEKSIKKSKKKKKSIRPQISNCGNVISNEFLMTYEWRKLRMEALKLHGSTCQCCGASPKTGAVMNVDHIKPRKLFPELALDINNLQVLCSECNHGKGNWDQTDWRKPLLLSKGI